jgi:hypothetical protein
MAGLSAWAGLRSKHLRLNDPAESSAAWMGAAQFRSVGFGSVGYSKDMFLSCGTLRLGKLESGLVRYGEV